jgi:energy-converting hydrogenase Eha subunit E
MNIAKNMEAIFVSAAVLIGMTSLATAAVPAHHSAPVHAAKVEQAAMQVVTVSAKRLSAAEKAALPH